MTLDEIIKNRRSVRKFKDQPIPRQIIEQCVEAARLAPSACNAQPCHYVIFDEEKAKNDFCDAAFTGVYSMCRPFVSKAPVLIAVCAKSAHNISTMIGQAISGTRFYLVDQGIAVEHIVLKAQELGLGTCWIGWLDPKKAKKFLKLPLGVNCEIVIALGYPDETPAPRPRKEFGEIISYNKYK